MEAESCPLGVAITMMPQVTVTVRLQRTLLPTNYKRSSWLTIGDFEGKLTILLLAHGFRNF